MQQGAMLEVLYHVESHIGSLLGDRERWNTLDVDYEPPRVERIWTDFEGYRVYGHLIHPCSKALYHPHPWPSAIRVMGTYEMAIGWGDPTDINLHDAPAFAATMILSPGSCYEMTETGGWHYVRPFGKPSMSLMVTGKPWEESPGARHKDKLRAERKGKGFSPISQQSKDFIIQYLSDYYKPKEK